jgi:hypothetical protein
MVTRRQVAALIVDSLLPRPRPRAGHGIPSVVDDIGGAGAAAGHARRVIVESVQRISVRLLWLRRARCRGTAGGARCTARTAACMS